jgi:hypothetical protein
MRWVRENWRGAEIAPSQEAPAKRANLRRRDDLITVEQPAAPLRIA